MSDLESSIVRSGVVRPTCASFWLSAARGIVQYSMVACHSCVSKVIELVGEKFIAKMYSKMPWPSINASRSLGSYGGRFNFIVATCCYQPRPCVTWAAQPMLFEERLPDGLLVEKVMGLIAQYV